MAYTVIVHIQNEDPIVAEMEKLPGLSDTMIAFINPRKRDGKPIYYITEGSVAYLFPINRIGFLEVMASEEEEQEIISFFR